jgi:predicted RNase H-like HicB family nuclease
MKLRNFLILIEQGKDGWFVAKVPELQNCSTQGKTVQEAVERAKEAIQCCVEADDVKPNEMRFVGLQSVELKV